MYQFVLVFNPLMLSGNKRLNILKQICSFTGRHERVNYLQNLSYKKVSNDNDEKKTWISKCIKTSRRPMTLPSLQFSKNCHKKRSYKMKHFVLKTLKQLILEFQFWELFSMSLDIKLVFSLSGSLLLAIL